MCQPVSFIVRRNDVYRSPSGNDSHSDMLRELKLKDDSRSPDFVRVELTMDCDARKVESYRYKCDQDWVPEWYSDKEAELACREKLAALIREGIKLGGSLWDCPGLTSLPEGIKLGGSLWDCPGLTSLPEDIKLGGRLRNCKNLNIPDDRWYTLAEARAIMARGVKACR